MENPVIPWLREARARTLAVIQGLPPGALIGPRLRIVNPPLWELGHVGWFQERWLLRRGGRPSLRPDADALWDSIAIAHDRRWDLPLPDLDGTLAYVAAVARAAEEALAAPTAEDLYFARLAAFHEDMHLEAMAFSRQTLGYPAPRLPGAGPAPEGGGPRPGDVEVPGGTLLLGARPGPGFVFDNEKWAHPVQLRPFFVARAPVTQAEFAAFVDDGGYRRRPLWTEEGWRWREAARAEGPAYWVRDGGRWLRRDFDRLVPLEPHRPMVHVSAHEAEAWCRWAGRRLPTEAEWEAAAGAARAEEGGLAAEPRPWPWGGEAPAPDRAHLDARALHAIDVGALPAGDAACGCRQLVGNVWEWTASAFLPYPGFVPDPYREYSAPWFGTHRVLRGGSFATPARLLRRTFRNFYEPDRRDPWAGFRTCAA